MQLLVILSKCFISFGRSLQDLLENNIEDNDQDFECRKVFIGHNLCGEPHQCVHVIYELSFSPQSETLSLHIQFSTY